MADEIKAGASANEAMVKTTEPEPEPAHDPLRETGNGPSVSYETAKLEQVYGKPDSNGVYGRRG